MRRRALLVATAAFPLVGDRTWAYSVAVPERRWYVAAESMRERALAWGDQGYGAVVVLDAALVGEGPSRVVKDGDPDAHAERVALLDAQRRLGRSALDGAVLYSTSRPCAACERAAARAGIARMYYGSDLTDAGRPHSTKD